jgi:hypothetical protein
MTIVLVSILVLFICFIVGVVGLYFGMKAADVALSKLFEEDE